MGYSITKVGETLSNDHLRRLGDEVKRASVLMALSAAGIPLGDILQDSAQRQPALAACEVEQRKKFEKCRTPRAEKNTLLQSEMEPVTRQYMERMNRNLTGVQQEKDVLQKWQTAVQHEVLQISEAVTLCARRLIMPRG
jgi:Arc/MetJ family transcription regulator